MTTCAGIGPYLAISFAFFDPVWGITTQGRCHGNSDAVKRRVSSQTSALHGGHHRGHLLGFVVWDRDDGMVCGHLACAIVAPLPLLGLWLVPGLGTTDHHPLSVVERGGPRQTLVALLCLLGGPLSTARYRLWAQVIRCGASVIPLGEGSTIAVDAHTAKQSGRHLAGRQRYCHGAGSARQAARVLAGLNVVVPSMRLPLALWPEPHLSLPMGLERSPQAPLAPTLGLP